MDFRIVVKEGFQYKVVYSVLDISLLLKEAGLNLFSETSYSLKIMIIINK